MKVSTTLVLSAFSAVALAQVNLGDLPSCARGCIGTSVNVPGCNGLDIRCICSNQSFLGDIACCLQRECNQSDQENAVRFASSLCSSAGVDVPDSVACGSSSSSSETGTSSLATDEEGSTTNTAGPTDTATLTESPGPVGSTPTQTGTGTPIETTNEATSTQNAETTDVAEPTSAAAATATPNVANAMVNNCLGVAGAAVMAVMAVL
ncbi:MAG: hypothetical protein M1817_004400 [Caeruleum heppii]|nr:MAG: hypothetical protein M1817_004400 [Caeruleum heppii]